MKIKIEKEDTIWSKLVRARDGQCRKCGKKPPYKLDAHHIVPRSRSSTRYLLDNGITLCVHHHTFGDNCIHRRGKEMAIEIVGQAEYDRLEKLSLVYKSRDQAKKELLDSLSFKKETT